MRAPEILPFEDSGHANTATRDHTRPSFSSSNRLICRKFLLSDDHACPPVPRSELMKDIWGNSWGCDYFQRLLGWVQPDLAHSENGHVTAGTLDLIRRRDLLVELELIEGVGVDVEGHRRRVAGPAGDFGDAAPSLINSETKL
jgi:hypothetical protein